MAARRKVEQVLQQEIDTDDQWNDLMSKPGLIVLEAFQKWCGSCKAVEGLLRKAKMDLQNDKVPLIFAIAKADQITALEDYRGRCEPCFLFYGGGELVSVIRGANAPVIIRTITEQLEREHKVMAGEAKRATITDPFIAKQKIKKAQEADAAKVENIMTTTEPVTICIVKPNNKEKQNEIVAKIKERGYHIVEQKEVTFTEEMAREFYKNQAKSEHFEELITYMTSGVSQVLALSRKGDGNSKDVINDWRADVGPTDLEEAKSNPDTFRAQYATSKLMNALHSSDSHESAARELAFFFPNAQKSGANQEKTNRTLALIRPSALEKEKDAILEKIKQSGFKIAMTKLVQFTEKQAKDFYSEHKDKPFFDDLVKEMTKGKMMVLCLVKNNAVTEWRSILGPKDPEEIKKATGTLRNEFQLENQKINALHGASTPEQAQRELKQFFPMEQTIAVLKPGLTQQQKDEIEQKIKASGFLIACKKSTKLTEEIASDFYKDADGKSYKKDLVNLMTSGDTDILVLSRENAIEGWREVLGETDPVKAKEKNPESLRALYGVDILNNGLHGPSNKQQAERELKMFFAASEFDESGRLKS